ncbi:MAG TPA: formylglycine-generating enzyme family protein [Gammaproteobacteria bacterium]|nr:formylglycine-generating enzyme family protein [Gammaproteobacteria bacterium]
MHKNQFYLLLLIALGLGLIINIVIQLPDDEILSDSVEGSAVSDAVDLFSESLSDHSSSDLLLPEMVSVPAGEFQMGGLDSNIEREHPIRQIFIESFSLSRFEVTLAQYTQFAKATNRELPEDLRGWNQGDLPVFNVTWRDAQAYVDWLSEVTLQQYRLPSEAEWEYAARAGSESRYSWGDQIENNLASCQGCGSSWDGNSPAPVGSFAPNGFGLHDMHGNQWEWVADCWNETYEQAPTDGEPWLEGDCRYRVIRGGSWSHEPHHMRSAARSKEALFRKNLVIGFRVARDEL